MMVPAIFVRSRDHRTQFWKEAIQGPFHQSLVAIGSVVSEEKIKMWNVDGRKARLSPRFSASSNKFYIYCQQTNIVYIYSLIEYFQFGPNRVLAKIL
jgi:hypothetical protein